MKYFLFCVAFIFGCSSSYQNIERNNSLQAGVYDSTSSSETYIVKTVKDFEPSSFLTYGGIYKGEAPYQNSLIDGLFYTIKRDSNIEESEFIKKIGALKGVYYIEKNMQIEAPKTFPSKEISSILHPFGLDDGNLKGDPDALYYEYALRITKARDYVEFDGTKKKGAYTEVGYGDNTVVIAIIDTGLNMRHPDFTRNGKTICLYAKSKYSENIIGSDFAEEDSLREVSIGSNEDGAGHGTHCSGTMCAVGGNNEGIVGVSYKNTYLISYKGLTFRTGSFQAIYTPLADLAEIVKILKKEPSKRTEDEKAKIPKSVPDGFKITQKTVPVNMSLGSNSTNQFAMEMLSVAVQNDILPVIAMANNGRIEPAYPRSFYGCIAVGATDNKDRRADFSDAGEWMSVCAPGVDIVSTYNGNWRGSTPIANTDTQGVQFMSGTSMATPFVTGMIGYLLSFDEGQKLNAQQIKRLLEITAEKVDTNNPYFGNYVNGHSLYYGYGRVDVLEAARSVAKKENAKHIPQVDSFYLSKPMTCKTPYESIVIRLYEEISQDSYFPQGLAITDSNKITRFYGLKKGTRYRIACDVGGKEKEHIFTATDVGEMVYEFKN
ncbi:MAG: dentilisin complex serine proteinase subunit PrtP [Treponema sp.]